VMVDAHSGLAGIAHWINSFFRLKGELAVDKKSELVQKIKAAVDELYSQGRTTVMGDGELEDLVREIDEEAYIEMSHHMKLHKERESCSG
jgi:citrate (Re)-synthase